MNVITNHPLKCTIILSLLEEVIDPELGVNIVDLGLIYQVDIDEDARCIFLSMTLTTPFCPMGESIVNGAQKKLQSAFPGQEIKISLIFDPPWDHTRISEKGKELLNR